MKFSLLWRSGYAPSLHAVLINATAMLVFCWGLALVRMESRVRFIASLSLKPYSQVLAPSELHPLALPNVITPLALSEETALSFPPHTLVVDTDPDSGTHVATSETRDSITSQTPELTMPGALHASLDSVKIKKQRASASIFHTTADVRRFDADVQLMVRAVRNESVLPSTSAAKNISSQMFDGFPTATEANVAFFVQISEETLPLLPRLLRKLWHPHNVYALHFDAKIPTRDVRRFIRPIRAETKFSNVFIMASEPVTYMGISMLLNTLSAMQLLLSKSAKWDYFINISGSDYPLVDVANIRRLLGALDQPVNFVHAARNIEMWKRVEKPRFSVMHFDTALGFRTDIEHTLLRSWYTYPIYSSAMHGFTFVRGEAWIIGHRSFCEFSVKSSFARRLLILMSNMQDPEEHFFQTLAWNDRKFNKTVARHSLREIWWTDRGVSGQHPFPVDRQRSSDGQWEFWETLTKSPMWFTRKFRNPNSELMDHIDRLKSGSHESPNQAAVVHSFELAKDRFSCLLNENRKALTASSPIPESTRCFGHSNWMQKGCHSGKKGLCPENRPDLTIPLGPLAPS